MWASGQSLCHCPDAGVRLKLDLVLCHHQPLLDITFEVLDLYMYAFNSLFCPNAVLNFEIVFDWN